ncbi:hypothetical protein ACOMHN_047667 [Nucella lapillus]
MGAVSQWLLCVFLVLPALPLVTGQPQASWMKATLTSHFSKPRHHVTNPQYKMAAKEFIEKEFRDMGLTTEIHTFNTSQENVKGHNVIGILKGAHFGTANDSIVAISAHYDTMRNTPGVNDNGAAVVVMLEAARSIAQRKIRPSTVLFISFDFEEWEQENDAGCRTTTCGSTALVSNWLTTYFTHWPLAWHGLANMDVVLNFDEDKNSQNFPRGLGLAFPSQLASLKGDNYEGDFLTLAGRTPEDSQILNDFNSSWRKQGHPNFETEVFPLPVLILDQPHAGQFLRSDHAAFWKANLTAIFLTDTANFRGYMVACYHNQCDNITYATDERMQFATKISQALISWVDLVNPPKKTSSAALLSPCRLSTLVAIFVVTVTSEWMR